MPAIQMDEKRYKNYASRKEKEFEAICTRCGACCGAGDDPCVNLKKREDGTYWCRVYPVRLGPQKTVSGNSFTCVPIRQHIAKGTLRPGCAYHR